ncbi:ABC transporter permease [Nocardiopsis sp. MG754419]|uniref:ABC transporter permease n=1 Tax=Nocardiopsis sp. MG754419 TaxID=2259865 RepID=UPI0027DB186D|nr:ABC transporter permease [Nocardiopsis sp. MG754419]
MANEFTKMRRLRVAPLVLIMVVGVVALTCVTFTAPGFLDSVDDPDARPWHWLLAGLALAVPLVSPILLAVLASRQVDMEHQGHGWLLNQVSGVTPGHLCRVKFLSMGALVAGATLAQSALVVALGRAVGISVDLPLGPWLGYTTAIIVVNLVLFALHLLVAARVPNQLVGLGLGVLGVFVTLAGTGMPLWSAHLLPPWGYYAVATPVDTDAGGVVALDPPYLSVLSLGIVGALVFLGVTRMFDRQET